MQKRIAWRFAFGACVLGAPGCTSGTLTPPGDIVGVSANSASAVSAPQPAAQTQASASAPVAVGVAASGTPAAQATTGPQSAYALAPANGQPAIAAQKPAMAASIARVSFAPVIGAPASAVRPLSASLSTQAGQRGIAVETQTASASDNILRGYFSALNDGDKTTVVFVWDVLDPKGKRVDRIQGQETIPGKTSDPWSSVPAATMERIATRVLDGYLAWYKTRKG